MGISDEEGYETIPADKRKGSYDPGYETLPPVGGLGGNSHGYESVNKTDDAEDDIEIVDENNPEYNRLKDADMSYIDESADELEDGLSDLKSGTNRHAKLFL